MKQWYITDEARELPTPSLLIFPERIEENIGRMIRIAGSPGKLRPHVKTHKMSEVVRLQVAKGITRFKCSTITEARVTAMSGATDVLLAMQPVGIQIDRFFDLIVEFPSVTLSTIVDDPDVAQQIATRAQELKTIVHLWVDINNGMNRTGISPGKQAFQLYKKINETRHLKARGLHVYDGHIHETGFADRQAKCERDFEPVLTLSGEITKAGMDKPVIVAGGTPTFPIHAKRENTETSPGTCLLWDNGYEERFPDLRFLQAAVLLTRVVSKPAKNLICLDLGHKSIAAEMPHPRIRFFGLDVKQFVNHSEEHLVVETEVADKLRCGDLVYGVPRHICPTVPRYPLAYTVIGNKKIGEWNIDARDRI